MLLMSTPFSDRVSRRDAWNVLPGSAEIGAWPFLILANQMVSYLVLDNNDHSGKVFPAIPADEVSRAKEQPAAKPGSTIESKPTPTQGLTAEPNTDQAKAIAEIEKLGGKVTVDEKSPGKPVIRVDLDQSNWDGGDRRRVRASKRLYPTPITESGTYPGYRRRTSKPQGFDQTQRTGPCWNQGR